MTPYDRDLDRNPANFQPLTPLSLLERAAAVFPVLPCDIPQVSRSPARSDSSEPPVAAPARTVCGGLSCFVRRGLC